MWNIIVEKLPSAFVLFVISRRVFKRVTNMKEKDPIEEELCKAGEASQVSPLVVQLDKCRIMSDTKVPPEDFLFRLFGKPCFPRRDLSTITGTEKCGKTFFTSMMMACCSEKNILELERIGDEPLKVMWYDTEQSRQSTKSILTDRVYNLIKTDKADVTDFDSRYFAFNVRACTCEERMDCLVAGIATYRPDMVIIDNVSDLLSSVNDQEESARVIGQLMQLSTEYECNITIVIHLNRSGEKRSLRGWLGTEILHKTFDVYHCQQIDKTDVFSVEQTFTSKYRTNEVMYYKIKDNGLPALTVKPIVQAGDSNDQSSTSKAEAYQIKPEVVKAFNQKYIIYNDPNAQQSWEWNLHLLFNDALSGFPSLTLEALQNQVMSLSGIKQPKYYEKVFKLAVDHRVVRTTMDNHGRVVVILSPSLPNPLLL